MVGELHPLQVCVALDSDPMDLDRPPKAAKLIGPPATFDASKLEVILKGKQKDQYTSIIRMTYNLSHCDFTVDLTLTILDVVDHDQLKVWYNKDDIVAQWAKVKGHMCLDVHCYVLDKSRTSLLWRISLQALIERDSAYETWLLYQDLVPYEDTLPDTRTRASSALHPLGDSAVVRAKVMVGNTVEDTDLCIPLKEALRKPFTRRIIKFARQYAANSREWPMPLWCRMLQQTLDVSSRGWFEHLLAGSINELAELREVFTTIYCAKGIEAFANTELPNGEVPEHTRKSYLSRPRGTNDLQRGYNGGDGRQNDDQNVHKSQDHYASYKGMDHRASYPPPRRDYQGRVAPVLTPNSLVKPPKEILATETQLRLPPPRHMLNPHKTYNMDRYCDYHQEKGHHTNDCFQLRKQLDMALESKKLNHLVKDVRHRGRGGHRGNTPQQAKIINMIRTMPKK
ncbi:reverse transcriptase domain-containing protein [Tanacetum coccineum]